MRHEIHHQACTGPEAMSRRREMNSDDLGRGLDGRATRGEQLSAEDQAQLEAWYAAQDRAETDVWAWLRWRWMSHLADPGRVCDRAVDCYQPPNPENRCRECRLTPRNQHAPPSTGHTSPTTASMSIKPAIREQVRQRAQLACEFCGIAEADVGSQLTIDHFQPRAKGGDDSLDNLIYCCAACNQYNTTTGHLPPTPHPCGTPGNPPRSTFLNLTMACFIR